MTCNDLEKSSSLKSQLKDKLHRKAPFFIVKDRRNRSTAYAVASNLIQHVERVQVWTGMDVCYSCSYANIYDRSKMSPLHMLKRIDFEGDTL